MTPEFAVQLMKQALLTTFWISAPLLVVAFVFGAIVNIIQVATSMQDSAFSTVPRLAAFLLTIFFVMPWMLNKMMSYTILLLGDLGRYAK